MKGIPHYPYNEKASELPLVCRETYSTTLIFEDVNGCSETWGCWGKRTPHPAKHMFVSGHVYGKSKDGKVHPISNATIDVWQPGPTGDYSPVYEKATDVECRAAISTSPQGKYRFESYQPGLLFVFFCFDEIKDYLICFCCSWLCNFQVIMEFQDFLQKCL
jgi:protocatechuate 3,4-dioxygenase beta subunit